MQLDRSSCSRATATRSSAWSACSTRPTTRASSRRSSTTPPRRANPAERAKLLKRLAKLATAREDDVAALERWEQTLRASPSDPDALAALSALYERAQRWPELAQILERLDGGRPLPQPATPDAAIRAVDLERYAVTVDEHLKDPARAIKAWHRLLELTPKNRNALEALTPAVPLARQVARARRRARPPGRR